MINLLRPCLVRNFRADFRQAHLLNPLPMSQARISRHGGSPISSKDIVRSKRFCPNSKRLRLVLAKALSTSFRPNMSKCVVPHPNF